MAAAFAADADDFARAFRGLSDLSAEAMGRELLAGLDQAARIAGDRRASAFACNRIPWPHMRAAGAELGQRLDAWTAPPRRQALPGRKRLARLALRLLRNGAPGRDVLLQLDQANATLEAPIAAEAVAEVARWAAAEVRRLPRVA